MTHPDKPEPAGMAIAVPFVVCQTHGGTYDDDAFCAGFSCGEVDMALKVGAASNAEVVLFPMARTDLVRQYELMAMNRGFLGMKFTASEDVPEWGEIRFSRGAPYEL